MNIKLFISFTRIWSEETRRLQFGRPEVSLSPSFIILKNVFIQYLQRPISCQYYTISPFNPERLHQFISLRFDLLGYTIHGPLMPTTGRFGIFIWKFLCVGHVPTFVRIRRLPRSLSDLRGALSPTADCLLLGSDTGTPSQLTVI